MEKTYLTRLKEGALYALLFMGLFLLVNFITDYQGTSTFFRELIQSEGNTLFICLLTLVAAWIGLSLLISIGLFLSDFLIKKRKTPKK